MSNKNKAKSTAAVFGEKPTWMMFGWLPVRIKPLTLHQIWEIGELLCQCEQMDSQGQFNAIEKMLAAHADLRLVQKVVVKAIFRTSIARVLFGWYIRRLTTMKRYRKVIEFCATSFDAPFFFQSMIFLRGAKRIVTNTHEAQAHGDL